MKIKMELNSDLNQSDDNEVVILSNKRSSSDDQNVSKKQLKLSDCTTTSSNNRKKSVFGSILVKIKIVMKWFVKLINGTKLKENTWQTLKVTWNPIILKFFNLLNMKIIPKSQQKKQMKNQRGTYVKPLCVGKDFWPCGSMANILTHLRPKYYILVTSDSREKKFFPHFF